MESKTDSLTIYQVMRSSLLQWSEKPIRSVLLRRRLHGDSRTAYLCSKAAIQTVLCEPYQSPSVKKSTQ